MLELWKYMEPRKPKENNGIMKESSKTKKGSLEWVRFLAFMRIILNCT
jgi:hypothetical protein